MTTLASQTIFDGPRHAVIKLQIAGTAGAELSGSVAVNVSELNGAPKTVRVMRADSALDGFTATLAWDGAVDVPFLTLSGTHKHDFGKEGGLRNNAGAGNTGDILVSTLGVGANEAGTILLDLIKKF